MNNPVSSIILILTNFKLTIKDAEQQFLRKLLFYTGKSKETFIHINKTFQESLKNIENSYVKLQDWEIVNNAGNLHIYVWFFSFY
jgi:hypothetical protein